MQHQPAVTKGPPGSALHLLSNESILDTQAIVREDALVKEVAELLVELVVFVVRDLEDAILDPERVLVVDPGILTSDLGRPATQILAIEQLDPLLFCRGIVSEGRSTENKRVKAGGEQAGIDHGGFLRLSSF